MDINFSTDQAKIFVEVAQCKNITRASKKLSISQPAITQTINKLEKTFQAQLLVRTTKGVRLTQQGKVLLKHFSGILAESANTKQKILASGLPQKTTLRIGFSLGMKWLVNPAIKFYSKQYAGLKIETKDLSPEEFEEEILAGALDFAICPYCETLSANLEQIEILESGYALAMPNKTAKLFGATVNIRELNNFDFVLQNKNSTTRHVFNALLASTKTQIVPKIVVDRFSSVINFIEMGLGVGFLPEYIATNFSRKIAIKKLENPIQKQKFVVIKNKNYTTPLIQKFIKKIKNTAEKNKNK